MSYLYEIELYKWRNGSSGEVDGVFAVKMGRVKKNRVLLSGHGFKSLFSLFKKSTVALFGKRYLGFCKNFTKVLKIHFSLIFCRQKHNKVSFFELLMLHENLCNAELLFYIKFLLCVGTETALV